MDPHLRGDDDLILDCVIELYLSSPYAFVITLRLSSHNAFVVILAQAGISLQNSNKLLLFFGSSLQATLSIN